MLHFSASQISSYYSVAVAITRISMKSIFIFVLIFLLLELISNVDGQGSPIGSIGTYIIKFKERKRQKALRKERRQNKTKKSLAKSSRVACDRFPFYESCRPYYTFSRLDD